MKAFRVKYKTQHYNVLSELVLTESKNTIPEHLAAVSTKGFILGHPDCVVLDATEMPIEDLPVRDLTIGQLYKLIDNRVTQCETYAKGDANS